MKRRIATVALAAVAAIAFPLASTASAQVTLPSWIEAYLDRDAGVIGTTFTLSGFVACGDAYVASPVVRIDYRFPSSQNVIIGRTVVGSADGTFSFRHIPSRITEYRATFLGTPSCDTWSTDWQRANVRVGIPFSVNNIFPRVGSVVTFSGRVLPAHPFTLVLLQRLKPDGSGWTTVAATRTDLSSSFRFTVRHRAFGALVYRALWQKQSSTHEWNGSKRIRVEWLAA